MKTIPVECLACGHEQKSIVPRESVSPMMRGVILCGEPHELVCPKCDAQSMTEREVGGDG